MKATSTSAIAKYIGQPDCKNCQNGDGTGTCGLNPLIGSDIVKTYDICIRFFRKINGLNTHFKSPGVFFRDGERCIFQYFGGACMEWKCNIGKEDVDCSAVCKETTCPTYKGMKEIIDRYKK